MCLNIWKKRTDLLSAAETLRGAGFSSCLWRQDTAWPWGDPSGLLLPHLQQPTLLGSEQTSSPHQPEVSQPSLPAVSLLWTPEAEVQHHKDIHYPYFPQKGFWAGRGRWCVPMKSTASKLCSNPNWGNNKNIPGHRDVGDKLPEANEISHLNTRQVRYIILKKSTSILVSKYLG